MNVSNAIKYIADKEGAHVINPKKQDERLVASLAVVFYAASCEISDGKATSYLRHWEQFIIDAGVRLLLAQKKHQGQPEPLFKEMEPLFMGEEGVPTAPIKVGFIQWKHR